jgi:hypothetical protein
VDGDQDTARDRLLQSFEMWEDGVQLKRESLRRRSPQLSEASIEAQLTRWLAEPDGVSDDFVLVEWPRPRR